MTEIITPDICVIGAGSAGLSTAAGASQMGAETVLIEKGEMGGDCLNTGCVPSKSIIAAAHFAKAHSRGKSFGVDGDQPTIDFRAVHDHVHGVIASIAPHDSVERFEGMGVRVIKEKAAFAGPREVHAGDKIIRARRFVVATGSRAMVPPIPGLNDVAFMTNETVFDLTERPDHLIVIGGGPIGMELAQAHRRLGARVTVLEIFRSLSKDDPELTAVVLDQVRRDGVEVLDGIKVKGIAPGKGQQAIAVTIEADGAVRVIEGSHLLVAAGRAPNVSDLNLESAGIEYSKQGIKVDARLRTSNKRVFAMGDVIGGYQFTHVAGYHAGIVIRNALFRLPAKVDYRALPWVTFTDPELAHVGLAEEQAREAHGAIRVLRWPFGENDRAQAERATDGLIKVVTTKKGRILGASIVGPHAGELLLPWIIAIQQKQKIGTMASIIAPYPTLSEVSKRLAGSYYTEALFSDRTRRIVKFLSKFG